MRGASDRLRKPLAPSSIMILSSACRLSAKSQPPKWKSPGAASACATRLEFLWDAAGGENVMLAWDPIKASFQPNPKPFRQNTELSSSSRPEMSDSCSALAGDVWSRLPADKTGERICADLVFEHRLLLLPRFVSASLRFVVGFSRLF